MNLIRSVVIDSVGNSYHDCSVHVEIDTRVNVTNKTLDPITNILFFDVRLNVYNELDKVK